MQVCIFNCCSQNVLKFLIFVGLIICYYEIASQVDSLTCRESFSKLNQFLIDYIICQCNETHLDIHLKSHFLSTPADTSFISTNSAITLE